jgi:hypothetical protein
MSQFDSVELNVKFNERPWSTILVVVHIWLSVSYGTRLDQQNQTVKYFPEELHPPHLPFLGLETYY